MIDADRRGGGESSKNLEQTILHSRLAAMFLFLAYGFFFTYWFSSVVQLITPGLILLCFALAWGSLRVSGNWILIGESVVLVAKFGWQEPRIELFPSLWLCYIGLLLFVFRTRYASFHTGIMHAMQFKTSEQSAGTSRPFLGMILSISYVLVGVVTAIVVSFFVLMYSPFGSGRELWINWSLAKREVMWPGSSAVLLIVGIALILRELNWRRITKQQAAIYVRADRIGWQYRELARVVKLMLKEDKKNRG